MEPNERCPLQPGETGVTETCCAPPACRAHQRPGREAAQPGPGAGGGRKAGAGAEGLPLLLVVKAGPEQPGANAGARPEWLGAPQGSGAALRG